MHWLKAIGTVSHIVSSPLLSCCICFLQLLRTPVIWASLTLTVAKSLKRLSRGWMIDWGADAKEICQQSRPIRLTFWPTSMTSRLSVSNLTKRSRLWAIVLPSHIELMIASVQCNLGTIQKDAVQCCLNFVSSRGSFSSWSLNSFSSWSPSPWECDSGCRLYLYLQCLSIQHSLMESQNCLMVRQYACAVWYGTGGVGRCEDEETGDFFESALWYREP